MLCCKEIMYWEIRRVSAVTSDCFIHGTDSWYVLLPCYLILCYCTGHFQIILVSILILIPKGPCVDVGKHKTTSSRTCNHRLWICWLPYKLKSRRLTNGHIFRSDNILNIQYDTIYHMPLKHQ